MRRIRQRCLKSSLVLLASIGEDSMPVVCSVGGSLEWVVSSCVGNTSVVGESFIVLF